jgi:DNA polymerase-3 subunit beta
LRSASTLAIPDITDRSWARTFASLLADAGSPTLIEDTEDRRTLVILMPMRV